MGSAGATGNEGPSCCVCVCAFPPLDILRALYRSKIILHLLEDSGRTEREKERCGHSSLNVFLDHLWAQNEENNRLAALSNKLIS